MIRFLLSLVLLTTSTITLAQTGEERVAEVYSSPEIKKMKQSTTNRYEIVVRYAEKGFNLSKEAKSNVEYIDVDVLYKADKTTSWDTEDFLSEMENKDFNPLNIHWRPGMSRQYYHLRNTDLYFEIPSIKELR